MHADFERKRIAGRVLEGQRKMRAARSRRTGASNAARPDARATPHTSPPTAHYKIKAGRLFASSASSHRGPDSAMLSPKQRASRRRSRIATRVPLVDGVDRIAQVPEWARVTATRVRGRYRSRTRGKRTTVYAEGAVEAGGEGVGPGSGDVNFRGRRDTSWTRWPSRSSASRAHRSSARASGPRAAPSP